MSNKILFLMFSPKSFFNRYFNIAGKFLSRFSFRTGIIVIILCGLFYLISFAQFLLPVSDTLKGILWVVFFGLAKTCQYAGILILGSEGWKRFKAKFLLQK